MRSLPLTVSLMLVCVAVSGDEMPTSSELIAQWPGQDQLKVFDTVSQDGVFQVRLGPLKEPIEIGVFGEWIVEIKDEAGEPVFPVRVSIGGGMQAHGHGLPTQPKATMYLGEGRYLIEGFKFNMGGTWTIHLTMQTEGYVDRATIEVEIDY